MEFYLPQATLNHQPQVRILQRGYRCPHRQLWKHQYLFAEGGSVRFPHVKAVPLTT